MRLFEILKRGVAGYIAHGSFSRGAAISFYVVTSLAPILLVVVAVAGIVFGRDAARGNLVQQMEGVFGREAGDFIQSILAKSSEGSSGLAATFSAVMVLVTASGVFGEMQAGLNRIWDVDATKRPWTSMARARAVSIGLVAALGFLMVVSLAASTAVTALGDHLGWTTPVLSALNAIVSFFLFAALFAVIYRVLPDTVVPWRDVLEGAMITSGLFTIGKSFVGWYLGAAAVGSGYGAAGAVILILIWSYYSTQIFLFGAEITRAVSQFRG